MSAQNMEAKRTEVKRESEESEISKEDEKEEEEVHTNRFQTGDQHSDITLVVEGRKLHVHKTLLMLHSPVFERMLLADFKEKGSGEIQLPGKKYSAVFDFLEQIYPGDPIYSISGENIEDLLQLADEYDVEQVFTNCTNFIGMQLCSQCSGETISTDYILFYLGLVERFERLHSLRENMVHRASQIPVHEMEKSKYFLSVPATATRDALLLQLKTRNQESNRYRR
ncbi:kelch-like protein 15 isoform X1 [Pomacea canaliculata]|uniref:kelch-like protein 15 isoform X1 n=1 Tax=Pomacea canaliculata TaxID=400727 RepID=UPI000D731FF9|nr:kelch-like protein 15 isoform X1 [Pomacea canaliculata]